MTINAYIESSTVLLFLEGNTQLSCQRIYHQEIYIYHHLLYGVTASVVEARTRCADGAGSSLCGNFLFVAGVICT